MSELTHFNAEGRARMVDVGGKEKTVREAVAEATVIVSRETMGLILGGGMKKGDVFAVAQVAGIMAAKRTPDVIPMCHPIAITGVDITFSPDIEHNIIHITSTVRCTGETGVEMEALTAASVAALTIYDMCKAAQKDIEITDIRLLRKSGGKSGAYVREAPGGKLF